MLKLTLLQIPIIIRQKEVFLLHDEHHGHPRSVSLLRRAPGLHHHCRRTTTTVFRAQGAQGSLFYITDSSQQSSKWFGCGVLNVE